MIKALSEPQTPKPEIPKQQIPKPKPKPQIEIRVNKKKLKELRQDFNKLRHKFSKKEVDRCRKVFYDVKNYKNLSISKIKKASKSLTELRKSLRFKKCCGNIDSVDYEDLDNYDYNYDFADDDEYRKIGSIRTLFKELDSDYYKPITTDSGFPGRNDNYIQYTSKGDRYENLSAKEYLNVFRPYLRDLIDEHKPIAELNNNNSFFLNFHFIFFKIILYTYTIKTLRYISLSKEKRIFLAVLIQKKIHILKLVKF